MMTRIIYVFVLLSFLLLASCDESKIESEKLESIDTLSVIENKIDSNYGTEITVAAIDTSVLTPKEKEYLKKQDEKKDRVISYENNIHQDKLTEFIPKSISGYEKLPGSSGRMVDNDGYVVTTTKGEYVSGRKSIIIDIFDYGRKPKIHNVEIYDNPPTDLEVPTIKVEHRGAKGFRYYDERMRYMRVEVLLKNRYVIIFRFNRPDVEREQALQYLDLINFENLIKLGN
ncbi:MAG: hypothetical protein CVV22_01315 [Ignavibacteriae bacterium HGW-Ignavibacteriae-1]|jgi:hypothetical protein|nr:MAG: hypothetical protein CVV22_01315 [Ignavibacteriae bacterium HGW-Ignavibacteriae-1]